MTRYARQMALPGYGAAAQKALTGSLVLVIGAGGLAASVLPALVGAGVGHITLVDADKVALSNLHRQTLFTEADIGHSKADVVAARMAALNAEATVLAIKDRFDPATGLSLIADMDLVLDCADSFAASYVASDLCLDAGVPMVSASIVAFEGYVGGFCGGAPGLRAVFPDLPARLGSCDADGVLGPSVGVIGSLQAQMALAILTGQSPSPLGQLVTYDAQNLRFGGFRFDGASNPAAQPAFIAPAAIGPEDQVIDLRAAEEHGPDLPGATRMTVAQTATLKPQGRVVFACRSGLRAWQAATHLAERNPCDIALIALGD